MGRILLQQIQPRQGPSTHGSTARHRQNSIVITNEEEKFPKLKTLTMTSHDARR